MALLLALPGCDRGPGHEGPLRFYEVEAPRARASLEEPGAWLLIPAGERRPPSGGARVLEVGEAEPLPAAVIQAEGPLVIVARDPREARRLAARLVRQGADPVMVVRGGLEAWQALGTGDPDEATQEESPRVARPQEGEQGDGRGSRGHGPEL